MPNAFSHWAITTKLQYGNIKSEYYEKHDFFSFENRTKSL